MCVQGVRRVVFVASELDALVLSSCGLAAVALPAQSPQWRHEQQAQHAQQQAHGLSAPPVRLEDPRLRLTQLSADLAQLRREHDIGLKRAAVTGSPPPQSSSSGDDSSSSSSGAATSAWGGDAPEGLLVSDVGGSGGSSISGLQLLLKARDRDVHAVIAMQGGPDAAAAGEELAELLDKVLCRAAQWPMLPAATPAEHEALAAAAAAAAAAADAGDSAELVPAVVAPAGADHDTCQAVRAMLGDAAMAAWSPLLVGVLLGEQAVLEAVDRAYVWPITGLERFADHALDMLRYWDTTDMGRLAVSSGWPSLDDFYMASVEGEGWLGVGDSARPGPLDPRTPLTHPLTHTPTLPRDSCLHSPLIHR
jgi:hypothetical protein